MTTDHEILRISGIERSFDHVMDLVMDENKPTADIQAHCLLLVARLKRRRVAVCKPLIPWANNRRHGTRYYK